MSCHPDRNNRLEWRVSKGNISPETGSPVAHTEVRETYILIGLIWIRSLLIFSRCDLDAACHVCEVRRNGARVPFPG